MNIFSDYHHSGLFHSLQLLFEKKLGHTLYRPIGLDWWKEGFWDVYHHEDTAKQYLLDGYIPKDGTPPLNGTSRIQDGIHYIKDTTHGGEQKAITLEQFKQMDIDIVIASIPQHIAPFKKLISLYHPNAKFVFQMGNMFSEVINNLHEIPNLLSSTIEIPVPPSCNAIFYHQEFPFEKFSPTSVLPQKKITSFINLLPETVWGGEFLSLEQELPGYEFKSHGILCRDGIISGIDNISSIMNSSMWGFHAKKYGDGFGHVLYNWFASGRPVITHISDYEDKLGGELLTDLETCINMDGRTIQEVANLIFENSSETKWSYMSQQAYKRFKEKVDYDKEQKRIEEWLGRLHG